MIVEQAKGHRGALRTADDDRTCERLVGQGIVLEQLCRAVVAADQSLLAHAIRARPLIDQDLMSEELRSLASMQQAMINCLPIDRTLFVRRAQRA